MTTDLLVADHGRVVDHLTVREKGAERDRQIEELFDRNFGRLCELAFLILGDRHLAEEIVMDALLRTFTGWNRIRDTSKADAYLKRAVVNLCRSKIRRKGIELRSNAITYRREELRPPAWDPEMHEQARLLWAAVRHLPVRQRACIVLRYVEDLPEQEIADVMDCSVGTVRSQISRARKKLGRWLEEHDVTEGVTR